MPMRFGQEVQEVLHASVILAWHTKRDSIRCRARAAPVFLSWRRLHLSFQTRSAMNINPYQSPRSDARADESPPDSSQVQSDAPTYGRAIVLAVAQHAVVLALATLILDGGRSLRVCAIAAGLSWGCTLLIMLRHPKQPTGVDLAIVKYSFWFVLLLVVVSWSLFGAI